MILKLLKNILPQIKRLVQVESALAIITPIEREKKLSERTLSFLLLLAFIKDKVRKALYWFSFANFVLSKAILDKIFSLFAVKFSTRFSKIMAKKNPD